MRRKIDGDRDLSSQEDGEDEEDEEDEDEEEEDEEEEDGDREDDGGQGQLERGQGLESGGQKVGKSRGGYVGAMPRKIRHRDDEDEADEGEALSNLSRS